MLDRSSPFPKSVGCIIGTNVEQPDPITSVRIIAAVYQFPTLIVVRWPNRFLSRQADHAFLTLDVKKEIDPFQPRIRFPSFYRRR